MSEVEAQSRRTFWCFISYRHSDNHAIGRQWATWLHQVIETYEVPRDLVGTINDRGDQIPERIFPVFRDEEELPADANLEIPIQRALEASKFLLVICSPRAVGSKYVNQEIAHFKRIGRADRLLAVIIAGEPNARWDSGKLRVGWKPEDECFPEALTRAINKSGDWLDDRSEPVAADFRLLEEQAEGWTSPEAYRQALTAEGLQDRKVIDKKVAAYRTRSDLMKLKVIAGIIGVPLGTLTQRDKAYQLRIARRRQRIVARIAAVLGLLLAASVGAGMYAWKKRAAAISASDLAEERLRQSQRANEESQRQLAVSNLAFAEQAQYNDRDAVRAAHLYLRAAAAFSAARDFGRESNARFAAARAVSSLAFSVPIALLRDEGGETPWANHCDAIMSPDGRMMLSWGYDGFARLWNLGAQTPQLRATYHHPGPVDLACFNGNLTAVVTTSGPKVFIWDLDESSHPRQVFGHEVNEENQRIEKLQFSADGGKLLTTIPGEAILWEIVNGASSRLRTINPEGLEEAMLSPKGDRLVTVADDEVSVWTTSVPLATKPLLLRKIPDSHQRSFTINQDGTKLLVGFANSVHLVPLISQQSEAAMEFRLPPVKGSDERAATGAGFSRDEKKLLAWGTDGVILLWAVANPKQPLRTFHHSSHIHQAILTRDESRIVTHSTFAVQVWQLAGDRDSPHRKFQATTVALVLNHDETRLLTGSGEIHIWDISESEYGETDDKTENPILRIDHPGGGRAEFRNNDTQILITGGLGMMSDGLARMWNLAEPAPWKKFSSGENGRAILNQRKTRIITWSFGTPKDTGVVIWDVNGNQIGRLEHGSEVNNVLALEGDRIVALGGANISLWDAKGTQLSTFLHEGVKTVELNSGHTLMCTIGSGKILVWKLPIMPDLAGGALLGSIQLLGTEPKPAIECPPEFKSVAFASSGDQIVLWNDTLAEAFALTESGLKSLGRFQHSDLVDKSGDGPKDPQLTEAIFVGNSMLLTLGGGKIVLWKLGEREAVRTLDHPAVVGLAINPRSTEIVSWGGDSLVTWSLAEGTSQDAIRKFEDRGVDGAAYNKDGTKIVSWGSDAVARLWNLTSPSDGPAQTFEHSQETNPDRVKHAVGGASLMADETRLVTSGADGTARLWHIGGGLKRPLQIFGNELDRNNAALPFDSDRKMLVCNGETVEIWDVMGDNVGTTADQMLRLEVRTATSLYNAYEVSVLSVDDWTKKKDIVEPLGRQ